mmetsp:Transcript_27881/g.77067  ORF Transcript_27881/g.77067 Transcript_27881/m.77067 type:complete len:255 (+) Transcript_27881:201-965(+)
MRDHHRPCACDHPHQGGCHFQRWHGPDSHPNRPRAHATRAPACSEDHGAYDEAAVHAAARVWQIEGVAQKRALHAEVLQRLKEWKGQQQGASHHERQAGIPSPRAEVQKGRDLAGPGHATDDQAAPEGCADEEFRRRDCDRRACNIDTLHNAQDACDKREQGDDERNQLDCHDRIWNISDGGCVRRQDGRGARQGGHQDAHRHECRHGDPRTETEPSQACQPMPRRATILQKRPRTNQEASNSKSHEQKSSLCG